MIFNENGVIINSPNFWVENVNRDINELNSIIESIHIDYLHEGFNLKEAASKFAAKVKKIFEWIKQKIGEIKNWLKSKFDPLINKIKTNKNKIVDNFEKLSKEQKEKLFKKNNSVNESYYLHESAGNFNGYPSDISKRFKISTMNIDRIFYRLKDNDSIEDAEQYYDKYIRILKHELVGIKDIDDNTGFEKFVRGYFRKLRNEFDNLDISDIINIATVGSGWLASLEGDVNNVEKTLNNKINELETTETRLSDDHFCYLKFFLNRAIVIIRIYTYEAIKYNKMIIFASGQICAQLLREKLYLDD